MGGEEPAFRPSEIDFRNWVTKQLTDAIFEADNDLVVPTASVYEANGSGIFPIADRRVFDEKAGISHTTLFPAPRGTGETAKLAWHLTTRHFHKASMIAYKDFWLRIERRGDEFWVSSRSSDAGDASARLELPPDFDSFHLSGLLESERAANRGEAQRDISFEGKAEQPENVGTELFQALFSGPIRDAFNRNWGSGKDGGVRIRLQTDLNDPQLAKLASLPWELLYNEGTQTSLGRSKLTPIVRYLDVPLSYETFGLDGPLRILIVLANPAGTHPLDLAREKESIERTWARLEGVEVTIVEHATQRAMFNMLDTGTFHVLHYMGHGGFDPKSGEGVLFLEDEAGAAAPLSGRMLGETLYEMRSMRLVFLNACDTGKTSDEQGQNPFSGVASALVMAGVPAVVAMQVPISDRAALEFAEKFYAQLAHKEPVDAAVAVGRRAIHRANPSSLEWATPVLFMRAEDGRLFDFETAAPTAETSPAAKPVVATTEPPSANSDNPDNPAFSADRPLTVAQKPSRPASLLSSSGDRTKYLLAGALAALVFILALLLWPTGDQDASRQVEEGEVYSEEDGEAFSDPADQFEDGGVNEPDVDAAPVFASLALSPGFEPHPMPVAIAEIGGLDEVSVSGPGCSGFISNEAPDVNVDYGGGGDLLWFFTEAAAGTTLLLYLPDGAWLCNADPEPAIYLEFPATGLYSIWVGAYSENDIGAAATLYLAETELVDE